MGDIKVNKMFFKKMDDSIEKGLLLSAKYLEKEIKKKLDRSGGVSVAGSSPIKKTGDLQKSIQVDATKIKSKVVKIGSDEDYAASLEGGTIKMSPRPYLRPAYRENKRGVINAFNKGGK